MTNRERFFMTKVGNTTYAALSLGCARYIHPTDFTVFKKTDDEKLEAKLIKLNHRKALREAYPSGIKRHLNVPSKSLEGKVVNTF